jgi:hypothetical protein
MKGELIMSKRGRNARKNRKTTKSRNQVRKQLYKSQAGTKLKPKDPNFQFADSGTSYRNYYY